MSMRIFALQQILTKLIIKQSIGFSNFNRSVFLKGPWRSGLQAVEKKLEKMGLHCNA